MQKLTAVGVRTDSDSIFGAVQYVHIEVPYDTNPYRYVEQLYGWYPELMFDGHTELVSTM